jgi:hypothetical protein
VSSHDGLGRPENTFRVMRDVITTSWLYLQAQGALYTL